MEFLLVAGPFLFNLPLLLAYLIGIGAGAILVSRGQRAAGTLSLIGFALLELRAVLEVIIALLPTYYSPTRIGQLSRWLTGVTFVANLVAALAICLIAIALVRTAGRSET